MLLSCRMELLQVNVNVLSQPEVNGTTGSAVTTPAAQWTMLSYQVMLIFSLFYQTHILQLLCLTLQDVCWRFISLRIRRLGRTEYLLRSMFSEGWMCIFAGNIISGELWHKLNKCHMQSRVLVVEGSLLEIPQTIEAILQACDPTHQQGVLVALTVSDVSCVKQHHQQFWQWTFCQSESILLARFAQLNVVIYDWTGFCQSQIGFWIHVRT
jgi:hypothetical protein